MEENESGMNLLPEFDIGSHDSNVNEYTKQIPGDSEGAYLFKDFGSWFALPNGQKKFFYDPDMTKADLVHLTYNPKLLKKETHQTLKVTSVDPIWYRKYHKDEHIREALEETNEYIRHHKSAASNSDYQDNLYILRSDTKRGGAEILSGMKKVMQSLKKNDKNISQKLLAEINNGKSFLSEMHNMIGKDYQTLCHEQRLIGHLTIKLISVLMGM